MVVKDIIRKALADIEASGKNIPNPMGEIYMLLEHLSGKDKLFLTLNKDFEVNEKDFFNLINKRLNDTPMAYIIGKKHFRDIIIKTDERALIPRFCTEELIDIVNGFIKPDDCVLDMCTGTGAIALAIKEENPLIHVACSDVSEDALNLAKENAKLNNLSINFILSDLFENINETYDILISNPPYISSEEYMGLEADLFKEPKLALVGGDLGYEYYEKIIKQAREKIKRMIFFEIGYDQGNIVKEILEKYKYKDIKIYKDLEGFDRFVSACI